MLIPKGRLIYFDERLHKYTDDFANTYTSCTTLIGKYHKHFDDDKVKIAKACERIGKNPRHEKYHHYKDKTWTQLLKEWELETKRACEKGSKKHDYLETRIKDASGYNLENGMIKDRLYTIDDIIKKHNYGRLSLRRIIELGIRDKYPEIYGIIEHFVNLDYRIYSEIGTYCVNFLISGLVDILLVNEKTHEFIILDWKTNKAPLRFESGYYEKFSDGTLNLDKFILQGRLMYDPINDLEDSVGNHYSLQLSIYAYLIETFGYTCKGLILCHIRTLEKELDANMENKEVLEFHDIVYMKSHVEKLFAHHAKTRLTERNLFV